MTSHMAHHLPEPDNAAFEARMAELIRMGMKTTATRRMVLATAHRFGWFEGPDGIAAILADGLAGRMSETEAAERRRMTRGLDENQVRPAKHRATFRAPENHVHEDRDWVIADDGATFYHLACGQTLPGGIDRADTGDKAAAHHHTCEAVRDV